MSKKLNIQKTILIILVSLFLLICLEAGGLFIYAVFRGTFSGNSFKKVFEVQKEKYTLKIIGEAEPDGTGTETTDIFSYETVKDKKHLEIGCGKLILVGYDEKKQYLYGKSEYGTEDTGFGIYENGEIQLHGNGSKENETEEDKKYRREFLRKQCTGYFVLNLKTGDYQGGLSEEQQNRLLSERGSENDMLSAKRFLSWYGKRMRNYEGMSDWMENY